MKPKSTSIYVFSATGNSLTTAKILHHEIEDSRLISIASVLHENEIVENAKRTVFVFPIYFHDVPFPVKMLISKMTWSCESPEIIAVSTSRKVQKTDEVYQRLHAELEKRGTALSDAFSIPMPGNSWANEPDEDELYLNQQEAAVLECLKYFGRKNEKDYSSTDLNQTAVSVLNNYRGIVSDDSCIGCGRCVQVCPMNNIHLEHGKAVVGDNCAVCLACFHWCPKEALWMSKNMADGRRKKYQHPKVSFEDIVKMKTR